MGDICPGCREELHSTNQHFCGSCGEPIDVDVDREWIRRQTSGFLDSRARSRILDSLQGERGPHHEYTHVEIQEQVRHVLLDFSLLNEWDEFDEREALLGDLERDEPETHDEDHLEHLLTVLGTYRFFFHSVGVGFIAKMLFDKVQREIEAASESESDDLEKFTDISLELVLEGDSLDDSQSFTYEDEL